MKKVILPIFLIACIASGIFVSTRSEASRSGDETSLEAANHYFGAYVSKDIDGMMRYAVDMNYLDDETRKANYEENAKTDSILDYEIVEHKKVSDTEMDISIRYTYSDSGKIWPLPYKVKKYDDGWKVFVEPLELNMVTGKVKKGTPFHQIQYTND